MMIIWSLVFHEPLFDISIWKHIFMKPWVEILRKSISFLEKLADTDHKSHH